MIKETYRYIWHVLLKSKKEKISVRDIKFKASKDISPYLELNLEDMNFNELPIEDGKYLVDVNPYIRFTDTFNSLLEVNYKKAKKLRESLGNLFLHFMGSIDMHEGRSVREYQLEFLIDDIEKGAFGSKVEVLFKYFTDLEKYMIAETIQDLYTYENRMEAYKKGVKKIYKDSIIYDNNFSSEYLVLYINSKDTEINHRKLELLNILFLPVGLKTRVFWSYHFGIVGVDITMKVGNMAVY